MKAPDRLWAIDGFAGLCVVYMVRLMTVGIGALGCMPLLSSPKVIHKPFYFPL